MGDYENGYYAAYMEQAKLRKEKRWRKRMERKWKFWIYVFYAVCLLFAAITIWGEQEPMEPVKAEITPITQATEPVVIPEVEPATEVPQESVMEEPEIPEESVMEEVDPLENAIALGECKITHYCCEKRKHICGTGDGITATGIEVGPGVVAVDPKVIPLHSDVYINGQWYKAEDTGGAIKGNRVDIAVPTHDEALQLGIIYAEVFYIPPQN